MADHAILSYNTCSFMLTLIVLRKLCVVQGIHRPWRTKHAPSGRLQEGKNNGKFQNCNAKNWSRSLTRDPTVVTGK